MKNFTLASETELYTILNDLEEQYRHFCTQNLKLNMARGKPSPSQLDLSAPLLEKMESYILEDGTDARNYGILEGIPECRRLFGETLGIDPDLILIGGNSSLNMMFDTLSFLCMFGTEGERPWLRHGFSGHSVKFLCPIPGYDRHFKICEKLGIEMIPVPLLDDGPDMEIVSGLAGTDPYIKGIWCVPLHSNPQGVCYSDRVVEQLASMETAACDFRIFWDNAYAIHPVYEEVSLKNIIKECRRYKHPNRPYYFFSTSKISFPGAGIALVASSPKNIEELKAHMSVQTIGHDKLNQLRHVQFFKTPENLKNHMKDLAEQLRPKFDAVLDKLETNLGGTHLATWSHPKGGYFISLDTLPGCAKETITLAKKAGVILTDAGATYPYGIDPSDTNIRIAPSYPAPHELELAMDILTVCIQIAGIKKLLKDQGGKRDGKQI